DFDPSKIALYDDHKISQLLGNPGIIRNRLKVNAAIRNAQAYLKVQQEFDTFDAYLWQFVGGNPIVNTWTSGHEIPAETEISRHMSSDLKQRGFRFVGPTICYAFMQAVGMVNDHTTDCFRYQEILDLYDR
ncbi:MAG: DNA-3-methyladenine glycosylase I, partial [Acidobacteriaceae bacterium]